MSTSSDSILVEQQGPLCTVTVNRPKVLNALNAEVIAGLTTQFESLAKQDDLRCVIITGSGPKAFVAGADIAQMSQMQISQARQFVFAGHAMALALENLPVPVIAAVNGFALGGGLELALAADFIYAADSAKLGLPEVTLGIIPGFGGTQRLQARVGNARARELIYTGKMIGAEEAKAIGLVNEVCAADALISTVTAVAESIASKGPLAVREAKRVLRLGADLPLERALVIEQETMAGLFATEDRAEGMKAFVEKRKASFQAR